ncbi:MAG: hypothetical protein RLZZ324_1171 [Candidatus Parcubacteria bacterium]|jgi:hypothetical protein
MTKTSLISVAVLIALTSACGMQRADEAKKPHVSVQADAGVDEDAGDSTPTVDSGAPEVPVADAGSPEPTPVADSGTPAPEPTVDSGTPAPTPEPTSAMPAPFKVMQTAAATAAGQVCFGLSTKYLAKELTCGRIVVYGGNIANVFVADADQTTRQDDGYMATCMKLDNGNYRITYVAASCATQEAYFDNYAMYGNPLSNLLGMTEEARKFLDVAQLMPSGTSCNVGGSNGVAIQFSVNGTVISPNGNAGPLTSTATGCFAK